jgi:uncharacterized protein
VFSVKSFIVNNLKKVRTKFRQLVALRASKNEISLGMGIGVFIGVFPTFGLGAIAIALITPFIKFNVPAALIGTLVANPLTMPFWFLLSCWVVGINPQSIKVSDESLLLIFRHFSGVLVTYMVGVTIVSIISGFISYAFTRIFLHYYLRRKKKPPPSDFALKS